MRTTILPIETGVDRVAGNAGAPPTGPRSDDFGRLLEARRRDTAASQARNAGRRRSAADRPERRPTSGDDQVIGGRATVRLGGKRTPRADRPSESDRPNQLDRPVDQPTTNRTPEPPAAGPTTASTTAPTVTTDASGTGTMPTDLGVVAVDTSAAVATTATVAATSAPSAGAARSDVSTNGTDVVAASGAHAATAAGPPTVAAPATDPGDGGTSAAEGAAAPQAMQGAGAVAPAGTPPTTPTAAPASPRPPDRVDTAPTTALAGMVAPSSGQAADTTSGEAGDDAPGDDIDRAEPAARTDRTDEVTAAAGATSAAPAATATAGQTAPAGPVAQSGAVARAMDVAMRADQAPQPITSRLAVELDDATRVAVHVHGQAVRVDVIEDPNTRLDAGWRRDVAEGIRRHGLEYERQGTDANDRRNRRDADEEERQTARDGGTRIRRRFAIDLNTAPSS